MGVITTYRHGGGVNNTYVDDAISTASGNIVSQIPTDFDNRYYTESELDNGQLDNRYYTENEVDIMLSTVSGGSGITDHAELSNLDYNSSGHIGFQSAGDYTTASELTTTSGDIIDQIITDHLLLNNLDYSNSGHTGFQPAGEYITSVQLTTTSGDLVSQIPTDFDGRYYTQTQTDVLLTTISGDIVYQLPSLVGYATEFYVSDNYVSNLNITTISGDIISQIPSLDGYATEFYVTSLSGILQSDIDSKADINHTHTLLNLTDTPTSYDVGKYLRSTSNGIEWATVSGGDGLDHSVLSNLDYSSSGHIGFQPLGDYLSNSEFSTYSGTLQTQIDEKSNVGHEHDDRYYTETELNSGQLDNRYYTENETDVLLLSASGTTNHAELSNLEYEFSGHIGFQPIGDYVTFSELTTISGDIISQIPSDFDSRYYTESEITTISGDITTQIITDHGDLLGLLDDDHTQYPLLIGRVGGQSIIGGIQSTDTLILQGTSGNGAPTVPAVQVNVGNGGTTNAMSIYNNTDVIIEGGLGLLGTTPDTNRAIDIYNALINPINGTKINNYQMYTSYTGIENVAESFRGFSSSVYCDIAAGHGNTSYITNLRFTTVRNSNGVDTDDDGYLGELYGNYLIFGHDSVNGSAAPETGTAYGFRIIPYIKTGIIYDLYGIHISSAEVGGSIGNYYGIYQEDVSAKNYFGGNVGIGTTAFGTNASGVLALGLADAPLDAVVDTAQVWSDPGGIFNVMDGSGNIRTVVTDGDLHTHSGVYELADATILKQVDVNDIPASGIVTEPISSNWAYDHINTINPHNITLIGFLSGMSLTVKDVDEFYVDVGTLDLSGTLYYIPSRLTKLTSGLSVSTFYHVYVKPPVSGYDITVSEVEYSTSAPIKNTVLGAGYHSTNTTWRWIGWLETDSSGNIIGIQSVKQINAIPVGDIVSFAIRETAPFGFISGDGSAISRTTYADLYAGHPGSIGVAFGNGDGSTTFNLPLYDGYFFRNTAFGAASDPDRATRTARADTISGDHPGTTQTDQNKTHLHGAATKDFFITVSTGGSNQLTTGGSLSPSYPPSTLYSGGNQSNPKNIGVATFIKYLTEM